MLDFSVTNTGTELDTASFENFIHARKPTILAAVLIMSNRIIR